MALVFCLLLAVNKTPKKFGNEAHRQGLIAEMTVVLVVRGLDDDTGHVVGLSSS